jgi:hypothetical protein
VARVAGWHQSCLGGEQRRVKCPFKAFLVRERREPRRAFREGEAVSDGKAPPGAPAEFPVPMSPQSSQSHYCTSDRALFWMGELASDPRAIGPGFSRLSER